MIEEFDKINGRLKVLISSYQLLNDFNSHIFSLLHNKLMSLLGKNFYLEDLKFQLIHTYNKIMKGEMVYLVKKANSYHYILWELHSRIVSMGKNIDKRFFPESIIEFDDILNTPKKILINNGYFFIITTLGNAQGHLSTIKIKEDMVYLEYNDSCKIRTEILKDRFTKKGWECSEIQVLEDIFPEKEGKDNYFFYAKHKDYINTMRDLAIELKICINTDWITINQDKKYKESEYKKEKQVILEAYQNYDKTGIPPREFLKVKIKTFS